MVYIVTSNDDRNFGAVLQAYALQNYLSTLGFDSSFITIKKNLNYMLDFSKRPDPKSIIKNISLLFTRKKYLECFKKFDRFVDEYQTTTKKCYNSYDELLAQPPKGNTYLVGSDQMWPPENMRPENFLEFAPKGAKRISYAVSLGRDNIPPEKKDEFSKHLLNIDSISLREESSQMAVKDCTDKEVCVNVDPTLLLDGDRWRELEKKPENFRHDKYILLYLIYVPPWINSELKKLKKETGLDIVLITTAPFKNVYCDEHLRYEGPQEFLWLVDNAEMVVSSSFHGCVFSAIFHKRFVAAVNPAKPARHRCLLKTLGLEDREVNSLKMTNFDVPDYDAVEKKLSYERQKSTDYLIKAIGEN